MLVEFFRVHENIHGGWGNYFLDEDSLSEFPGLLDESRISRERENSGTIWNVYTFCSCFILPEGLLCLFLR